MQLLKTIPQKSIIFGIFILFVVKGVFLSVLMPFFQNPDEPVHYGTIQHWAEPREKTWEIRRYSSEEYPLDPDNIQTSNLPQEMRETATLMSFNEIKSQNQNTQNFDDTDIESLIRGNTWVRQVDTVPSAVSGTWSWYYLLASWIEQYLSNSDIFTRMFALRTFSVVLGTLIVLLAYFTCRKINFSRFESLLLASLLAFQPMLTATAAQINIDIALIFSFSLFTFAGVWILKDGASWKNSLLLILSAILGFFAKGPGIVLIVSFIPLFSYAIWIRFGQKIREGISSLNMSPKTLWIFLVCAIVFIGTVLWNIIPASYISSITNASAVSKFDSPLASLAAYFDKTIDIDAFRWSAISYWGNFGWLDTKISGDIFRIIWIVEIIGLTGLIFFFIPWISWISDRVQDDKYSKKIFDFLIRKREFLPEKKYIVFLLLLSLALQSAIRFYDWCVFDATTKILIGTPGRYFLPNAVAHIILLVTGIGFFCRSRAQFQQLLKALLVLMILLSAYSLFDIILPRYYL